MITYIKRGHKWIIGGIIVAIVLALVARRGAVFSQNRFEPMGGGGNDADGSVINPEEENRKCQTQYLQKIQGILTGPSVDANAGYVSTADVLNQISGVGDSCKWNGKTAVEKKYAAFKTKWADNKNPNQLNDMLGSIQ